MADALLGVDVRTEAAFEWGAEQPLRVEQFWATGDARDYDVTPDGERFLVITPTEATGTEASEPAAPQIIVVENWLDGMASARLGVKMSPAVVPSWYDLAPDSEYLNSLYEVSLNSHVEYHLLFGYDKSAIFGFQRLDGIKCI